MGFALETNNEKENALQKLELKNADMIVLNSLRDANAGFGFNTNKVTIFNRKGNEFEFHLSSHKEIAEQILNLIINELTLTPP